jgi:peptide/nickel transport system ATP-binding protein
MSNEQILSIDGLTFGYSSDKLLYDNFSLSLRRGEIKAIVGPSGAGKSTLFELILGHLRPSGGSIDVLRVSQVFQDPYSSFHPSYSVINQIRDVTSLEGMEVSVIDEPGA